MPRRSKPSRPEPKASPKPIGQRTTEDERLFESTPVPDRDEFTHTDPWRVLRITGEFVQGFDELADVEWAVVVFGSARTPREAPWYLRAVETAKLLGKEKFAIITGGGPGIMEAANKGAKESGTESIGLNIELPHEQYANPYLDREIDFRYFFVRKTMFVKYACAFVVFPGGYGSMDELFEALTLIQTGKVKNFPVVLIGTKYWKGLVDWLENTVAAERNISPEDLLLFHVTDDPQDAVRIIVDARRRMMAATRKAQ
ncbi:MAG: TIGR00730 family Rossman fold protein [Gemmatimonadetes bacterium]|nr:TIGR00730 family Rossman fold protein [Gemmatimonadota bacterium]